MSKTLRKYPAKRWGIVKVTGEPKVFQDRESKNRKASRGCLNHGSCTYCEMRRKFFDTKKRTAADMDLKEFLEGNE